MQYFKTTTIIDGEGEQVATLEDVELTAEEVIKLLAAQVDVKEATPLPKVEKEQKLKTVKVAKFVPGKVKRKRKGITDAQIYEALDLRKDGSLSNAEICEKVGISSATFYRITTGALKPEGKRVENSPTPTKVGERAIDQKPAMLTSSQYAQAKADFNDGLTAGVVALSLNLDTEEVRKAVKCENYTEYTAKY